MLSHLHRFRLFLLAGGGVAVLVALGAALSPPKPGAALVRDFSWSKPQHSIFNPTFSHSGRELVFVQQWHIPDGHEAEEREDVARRRLDSLATNQRLADPVVAILPSGSQQAVPVDYGWNPAFSPDDSLLAYAFQQLPISGKRVLAATLAGNSIKLYHRGTRKQETVATPATGFLLEPVFTGPTTLWYKIGAATNGAFGGAVGLRQYDLRRQRDSVVYAPRRSFGNAHLLGEVYLTPQGVSYLLWRPLDKGFGYGATEYALTLQTPRDLLHSFGKLGLKNLDGRVAVAAGNSLVYLDDQHDLRSQPNYFVHYQRGAVVFKKRFTPIYKDAYLSPDGTRALICPYDSSPFLLELATFARTALALPATEVYSAVWSGTSRRVAVVQDDGTEDTDVISVFTLR